jgi:hypothetical protein
VQSWDLNPGSLTSIAYALNTTALTEDCDPKGRNEGSGEREEGREGKKRKLE